MTAFSNPRRNMAFELGLNFYASILLVSLALFSHNLCCFYFYLDFHQTRHNVCSTNMNLLVVYCYQCNIYHNQNNEGSSRKQCPTWPVYPISFNINVPAIPQIMQGTTDPGKVNQSFYPRNLQFPFLVNSRNKTTTFFFKSSADFFLFVRYA